MFLQALKLKCEQVNWIQVIMTQGTLSSAMHMHIHNSTALQSTTLQCTGAIFTSSQLYVVVGLAVIHKYCHLNLYHFAAQP